MHIDNSTKKKTIEFIHINNILILPSILFSSFFNALINNNNPQHLNNSNGNLTVNQLKSCPKHE